MPHIFLEKAVISGIRGLWRVDCSGLLSSSMSAGSTVTQHITPRSTPFAMTRSRSRPKVKVIKHSAAKPATVVVELPMTETRVSLIAAVITFLLSDMVCRFSL